MGIKKETKASPSGGGGNPYRGWTLVERTGGVYLTRDNVHYVKFRERQAPGTGAEGWGSAFMRDFHRRVDEIEDGR